MREVVFTWAKRQLFSARSWSQLSGCDFFSTFADLLTGGFEETSPVFLLKRNSLYSLSRKSFSLFKLFLHFLIGFSTAVISTTPKAAWGGLFHFPVHGGKSRHKLRILFYYLSLWYIVSGEKEQIWSLQRP